MPTTSRQRRLITSLVLIVLLLLITSLVNGRHIAVATATPAPILVVVNDASSNPFGHYIGEILRAEGLNAYDVIQLNSVTSSDLTQHKVVILTETPLTSVEATLFTSYVSGGGHLLAFRPDAQIAHLFGITLVGTNQSNGYLKIKSSHPAWGQGLTTATLQIHGTINHYTLNGASTVATLYNDPNTATSRPAIVTASYGAGQTAAFAYDLVQNIIYMRQGNPSNANIDIDGDTVLRTIDLFQTNGGGAPWVNRDKIPIPQADEQMRLLGHLIQDLSANVTPLPRLWYFPDNAMTMLILTADAHANPTDYYQDQINSISAHGGKITFYISQAGDPSSAQMQSWRTQGYEFGIHPDNPLADGYATMDDWWNLVHGTVPRSRTTRNHQLAWQGWTDAADIAVDHNIALDTSFYHWGPWTQKVDGSWPHGYITGSGQPMKFIKSDGTILPLYEQLTQLVDEHLISGLPGGFEGLTATQAINVSKQLIDQSLEKDYAALMTQFHVDYYNFGAPQVWAEETLDYAQSKNVPIWNADEWLNFTETRHDAVFSNLNWSTQTGQLNFTLQSGTSTTHQLTLMLPASTSIGQLIDVTVDGVVKNFNLKTIKGRQYAFLSVTPGSHQIVAFYPGTLPTNTSISTPSNTPTNTITNTPTSTPTSTPSNTPTNTTTNTPTSTSTSTPSNTPTNTTTDTPTSTSTSTPSNTPTNTTTDTPTSTSTSTPSNTPTNTITDTSTSTPTNTITSTSTSTPTHTLTPTTSIKDNIKPIYIPIIIQ